MMADKISVIVPAYNIEGYIEKTIQSIRKQTYSNLEIIIVDDGSKDDTPNIIDRLAIEDKRIKVIHKENRGVSSARFCGIEVATGEWVAFVDGDDYIEPEMYTVLMENARKYNADISHCGYQMVFPSRVDKYYGTGRLVEQDRDTGIKDLLEGIFIEPCPCNKLYKKSLFEELLQPGMFDMSIKINEDLLMNYYLFRKANKSVFMDECYYHYMLRVGSAATSKVNESKLRDPLKVLKILRNDTADKEDLQTIINRRIAQQLISLATMSLRNQRELIRPYRRKAREELRRILSQLVKGPYGIKIKLMAMWVGVWPASYSVIHVVYAKIRGIDKKYEVK